MQSRSTLAALAVVAVLGSLSTGCLIYRHGNEHPQLKHYAAIAAAEVATAALFALSKDDDPNSDYSKTPYPGRVAMFVGCFEFIDLLGVWVAQSDKK